MPKVNLPRKGTWEDYYNHEPKLSGIEIKDLNGDLVDFVTIVVDDDVLENKTPHRITLRLNENSKLILPPPQTFEEIIQAKRRQQMLLYGGGGGGGGSSSSNAILSARTARRVAAAARRTVVSASLAPPAGSALPKRPSSSSKSKSSSSNSSGIKSKKKKVTSGGGGSSKPSINSNASKVSTESRHHNNISTAATNSAAKTTPPAAVSPAASLSTSHNNNNQVESVHEPSGLSVSQPIAGTSGNQVVTSMKDLNKHNPLFNAIDPKEVKMLLKQAPPGSSIYLPDGTVIKKSRRGGARAGAGRKRSRPLPPGQQTPVSSSRNSNGSFQPASSSSSFSSQL